MTTTAGFRGGLTDLREGLAEKAHLLGDMCQPFRCRRLRHQRDYSSGDGGGEHAIIVRLRRRNDLSTTVGRETARTAHAQRRAHCSQVQPFRLFEQQQR